MYEYEFRPPPRPCEKIMVGHRLFSVFGERKSAFLWTGIVV
jgi:hypothetical protein